ncbi:MAG: flagellar hook assembly protein FlgD [Burkholderiaceae bacterium]
MNLQPMSGTDAAAAAAKTQAGAHNASTTGDDAGLTDRFMKLLVAQMNHQDPMNPLDNAQLTSQLAQINTVVGVNQLNTTVNGLMDSFALMQAMQAAQLTGRDVMVVDDKLKLPAGEDATVKGGVFLQSPADQVTVEIKDAKGTVVRTIELGATDHGVNAFEWDGLDSDGDPAGAGQYTFSVKASSGETKVPALSLSQHTVTGVQQGGGQVTLLLEGGLKVNYPDVIQIL